MPEHTPTPWQASFPDHGVGHIDQAGVPSDLTGNLATCWTDSSEDHPESRAQANAAFIVKAANSHDELVAALRDCIDRVTAAFPDAEIYEPIKKARAVLAKVEAA